MRARSWKTAVARNPPSANVFADIVFRSAHTRSRPGLPSVLMGPNVVRAPERPARRQDLPLRAGPAAPLLPVLRDAGALPPALPRASGHSRRAARGAGLGRGQARAGAPGPPRSTGSSPCAGRRPATSVATFNLDLPSGCWPDRPAGLRIRGSGACPPSLILRPERNATPFLLTTRRAGPSPGTKRPVGNPVTGRTSPDPC